MTYMKSGWTNTYTSQTVLETLPSHDVIDHKGGIICKCRPFVETRMDEGVLYWHIVHNSFDEYLDDDLVEPYKGL